jgi:hypothetical protein
MRESRQWQRPCVDPAWLLRHSSVSTATFSPLHFFARKSCLRISSKTVLFLRNFLVFPKLGTGLDREPVWTGNLELLYCLRFFVGVGPKLEQRKLSKSSGSIMILMAAGLQRGSGTVLDGTTGNARDLNENLTEAKRSF